MQYDVLIIGGGAAGLSAALSASRSGARTLVLEGAARVGRKILASGNGRCNLANLGPPDYPGGGEFARAVFQRVGPRDVLDFFHGLGLATCQEDMGRVYPACGQAAAVLDTLRLALDRAGAEVLCGAPVTRLEKTPGGFRAAAGENVFDASRVVAACGGMAGGKLGHDGGPYRLLTALGHTLVPPSPALTPLVTDKQAVKGLSGLRTPAVLTLCRRKRGLFDVSPRDRDVPICQSQGEALFTDYGVSGVCAMELSRAAGEERRQSGVWPVLYLDFSPMLGLTPRRFFHRNMDLSDPAAMEEAVLALLRERRHMLPEEEILTGLAPRLLRDRLRGQTGRALARSLCAFPAPLTGVRDFSAAQVTAGGVATEEFDPATMESKRVPGLYAAGEMLDVDGSCGGFNLQFAFASGILAGAQAGKKR